MITLLLSTEWGKSNLFVSIVMGVAVDLFIGYLISKVLLMFL